jgi:hypothetical protein
MVAVTHDAEAAQREASALQAEVEALYGQGRFEEAVGPAQRCVALFEQTLGAEHPDLAASLVNLAVVYLAQGAPGGRRQPGQPRAPVPAPGCRPTASCR